MNLKIKLFLIVLLVFNITLFAQNGSLVKGAVVSATDNIPIPGVNVIVLNTSKGTTTDFDGNYQIQVNEGDVLQFSYIGFVTQTVIINNQTTVNISLAEDLALLDEVVVVGYGTQKKSHLTGAISKVTNDNLDQIAVARVDDALVGQVSGVNIQASSAEAGAAPTITVRGFGSITADSGPAIVVDGIIVDASFLGNLDMNDVESFEVLKDAASAAIFGSEGANGVIQITTKTGKAGKTKFSYDTFTGYKQAFGSDDYKKSVADWADKEFAATGELSESTQYAQKIVEVTGIDRDWQDVFFNGGFITNHSLSMSGGTEDTKFTASLRYNHDEGVVITDDYKLYSAKLKLDSKLSEKVKFGLSATPSYSKRRALPTSIHNPIRQSPWLPIYHTTETLQFINRDTYPNVGVGDYFYENHLVELDLDGNGSDNRPRTTGDSNAYAQYAEREHYEFNTKLLGSAYLKYKIIDGLEAKTSLGVTIEQRKRTRYDGVKHHASGASRAEYLLQNRFRSRLISDNSLSYNKQFGNHEISALALVTFQKRKGETSQIVGTGYSNDLLKNLQGATTIVSEGEYNIEAVIRENHENFTRAGIGHFVNDSTPPNITILYKGEPIKSMIQGISGLSVIATDASEVSLLDAQLTGGPAEDTVYLAYSEKSKGTWALEQPRIFPALTEEEEFSLELRTRDRERKLIKKIEKKTFLNTISFNNEEITQYFGVFSSKHIDYATQFLIENLEPPEQLETVLDLASGNGILAKEVHKQFPDAEYHLVDDSQLAVESSKLNLEGEKIHFYHNNNLEDIASNSLDYIVSNPPFHVEYEIDISLPLRLFRAAEKKLKPEGKFQLVANTHLNYKPHLEKIFKKVEIVYDNDKFTVYSCYKAWAKKADW